MGLLRSAWVKLNRFRTGVGRFQSFMHKWGLAPTSIRECDAFNQTAAHVILKSPLHCASRGYYEMLVIDNEAQRCVNTIITSN